MTKVIKIYNWGRFFPTHCVSVPSILQESVYFGSGGSAFGDGPDVRSCESACRGRFFPYKSYSNDLSPLMCVWRGAEIINRFTILNQVLGKFKSYICIRLYSLCLTSLIILRCNSFAMNSYSSTLGKQTGTYLWRDLEPIAWELCSDVNRLDLRGMAPYERIKNAQVECTELSEVLVQWEIDI